MIAKARVSLLQQAALLDVHRESENSKPYRTWSTNTGRCMRTLRSLEARGFVRSDAVGKHAQDFQWTLTAEGASLVAAMLGARS